MKQILYDISDYKNNSDWLPIIASVFVLEMYVIFRAMRYKSVGELMHKWYADFGILSAIADITILLLAYINGSSINNITDINNLRALQSITAVSILFPVDDSERL